MGDNRSVRKGAAPPSNTQQGINRSNKDFGPLSNHPVPPASDIVFGRLCFETLK